MRGSIRVNQGKRGKSYSVVIDIPSQDGKRRQHRRTFPTRKLAQEYLAKTLGEVYGGVYVAPSGQTVAAYLGEWLRTVSTGTTLSPATLLNYEKAIKRLVPLIGSVRLDRLDQMGIQRAYGELAGKYAASTLALTHACLSKALRQAVGWKRLARNPSNGLRAPSHPKSSAEAWSAEQASVFLAFVRGGWLGERVDAVTDGALHEHGGHVLEFDSVVGAEQVAGFDVPERPIALPLDADEDAGRVVAHSLYPLYALALWTGMREGELLALTWADVNLDGALLTVRRTVSVGRDRKEFVRPGTKGGPGRRVSLGPEAVSLLRLHRRGVVDAGEHEEERLGGVSLLDEMVSPRFEQVIGDRGMAPKFEQNLPEFGAGQVGNRARGAIVLPHPTSWVFCRADGSRVSGVQARMRLLRLVRRLGLPEIGFHGLRHTHATLGLEAGVHPKVMAERLGHRTVGITLDVYSHVTHGLDQRAAEAVERRLAG
jgi:integrase